MRVLRGVREVALWALSLLGLGCLILAIAGIFGGWNVVLFKTGSMTPTIPAGSVALVHRIPAADIAVGDVIMVQRDGELPVTHRVTSVQLSGDTATFTMRGDANAQDDPTSYTRQEVSRVVGSLPGLAPVVIALGRPWVMGAVTVVVAVWVTWAFWPKRRGRRVAGDSLPDDDRNASQPSDALGAEPGGEATARAGEAEHVRLGP